MTGPSARRLRDAAVEYAAHGWPVAPLAIPSGGTCSCGGTCPAMHLLKDHADGITSERVAAGVWADHPWQIGITTAQFDVLDLPSPAGATLREHLKTRCPVATARPGRRTDWMLEPGPVRWHFYLHPGTVDPAKAKANAGKLHSGAGGWIPAPPSRTPDTGRVGWVVPPMQARWQPYRRADVFDQLGLV